MVIKYVHRCFYRRLRIDFVFANVYLYDGYVLIGICGETVISVIKLAFCAMKLKIVGNVVLWYEIAEGQI